MEVVYNFSSLDELIQMLWENNLKPGFELMGNPSNYFSDFENITQVYMWKNMIKAIAEHYIGKLVLSCFKHFADNAIQSSIVYYKNHKILLSHVKNPFLINEEFMYF